MLSLPSSWPLWSVWALFATLLAGLDLTMSLAGTMAVKTKGTSAMGGWLALGAIVALALFWLASSSLAYGDMLEMNVLWIAALMVLTPIVNGFLSGQLPSLRVMAGIAFMIASVGLIQWPESSPSQDHRTGPIVGEVIVERPLMWSDTGELAADTPRSSTVTPDFQKIISIDAGSVRQ